MTATSSTPTTTGPAAAAINANTTPNPGVRSGKIARLPAHIQEDLNQRLAQNHPARTILPWLNSISEVQAILRESFNDKRINEQNLSNWRRGGFHEWQYRQKFFACFRNVAQDAADIESTVGNLTEHAARLLALQFSLALCPPAGIRGHSNVPDYPPAIINNFCKIARAISSLRQGDHAAVRLKLQEQKQNQNQSPAPAPAPSPPQTIPPILHPSSPSSIGHSLSSIPTPAPPPPTEHRTRHPSTTHRTPTSPLPAIKPNQTKSSLFSPSPNPAPRTLTTQKNR